MHKFHQGQKVKVVIDRYDNGYSRTHILCGKVGTVTRLMEFRGRPYCVVKFMDAFDESIYEDNLETAEDLTPLQAEVLDYCKRELRHG